MSIQIKISKKRVSYEKAMIFLNKRVDEVKLGKNKELLWILEHPTTFTAGIRYNKKDIIDKGIKILKTNRGGKITLHNPNQKIVYFVINLNNRKKDIRKFILAIENSIIHTLKEINIKSFSDRNNVGIWTNHNNKIKKIAAIGIRVKRWIAFHGFSINYSNSLEEYKKIIPCGISDKGIININKIKKVDKDIIIKKLEKNLLKYLNY